MSPGRPSTEATKMDLRDPTTVAIEVTAIKGQMSLLAQQVSSGLGNVSSQLSALQGDLREVERSLSTVASQQHDIQSHSSGLDRLAKAIEQQTSENHTWRNEHVADNRIVADRVTLWRGVVIGTLLLAGLLSTAVVFIVQDGFQKAEIERSRIEKMHAQDVSRVEAQHAQAVSRLERQLDVLSVDVRELQDVRRLK